MSTATAPLQPGRTAPAWGPGRIVALAGGSLVALVALALLLGGMALVFGHATLRDSAGYYSSDTERFSTTTYALTSEGLQIGDVHGGGADWALEALDATVRVRVRGAGGTPVFVGIAPEGAVDGYLARTAHEEVSDVTSHPFAYDSIEREGTAAPAVPTSQRFWAATASGAGTQTLTWKPDEGRWAVVVMNADGSRDVAADVSIAAKSGAVLPLGIGLLGVGVLALLTAAGMIWLAVREPGSGEGGATTAAPAPVAAAAPASDAVVDARPHPVQLEARLDEPLSRWLWLVKWLLALPHWIVLAFLGIAFWVMSLVALVAIVFTGRYPRAIFDFNVGVLRWEWRVVYYAFALGTDRYPPFTLGPADYPAELEIPYPERLSRGKALVKPWLLAIPHYLVIAAFLGAWNATWADGQTTGGPPGLFTVLALIAGVVLLFTGRYPRDVFRLVVGMARWILRVIAYAALMRDEYPPFRLER